MAINGDLNGKLVVIMGGTGFVGRYVAQSLLERGARLRIVSRRPEEAYRLQPLANLGQIQFGRCDVTNHEDVRLCIAGADAVVNLVGGFDGDLKRLMGEAPGWMAEAASETGAAAFVHVSAIAPEPDEEAPNPYSDAKHVGEQRVRAAFPNATILRPSVIFGKDDDFLNRFATLISDWRVLPVFGPDAHLQPVYVDDVAEAVAVALKSPATFGGQTFELAGPDVMTMMEINEAIATAQRRERSFVPMPDGFSAFFAALPLTPINSAQWKLLKQGSVASGDLPGLSALGVEAKPLDLFLDRWMVRFRKHGRFAERLSA